MMGAKTDKRERDKRQELRERAERTPPQLLAHAKRRTSLVVARIEKAMMAIERDIEVNEGLYPLNGGRVTQAEVCRRAGIRNATLQGNAHKASTKLKVDTFVERVRRHTMAGDKSVRPEVAARADYWKRAHHAVADAYHIDALRFEEAKGRIRSLQDSHAQLSSEFEARIRALEDDNHKLRKTLAFLTGNKIVSPRGPKKG
ncbi:TPA: hypothetical protein QDA88_002677 [Burkholderia vietnamiensis]|nr:hypothetical protein [Burkholderia vietnamiensis]